MTLDDYVFKFLTSSKGWEAKNQILCRVAKIYGREGLVDFAKMAGKSIQELEKSYALRVTLQKKNRKRRGQKPIKHKKARDYTSEEIAPSLVYWYKRKDESK